MRHVDDPGRVRFTGRGLEWHPALANAGYAMSIDRALGTCHFTLAAQGGPAVHISEAEGHLVQALNFSRINGYVELLPEAPSSWAASVSPAATRAPRWSTRPFTEGSCCRPGLGPALPGAAGQPPIGSG